jgi:hypothetical protein
MDEAQPVSQGRKFIEGFENRAVDGLRTLASTEDQNRVRRAVKFWRDGFELRPDRVAGNDFNI